jgi:hypothetical protein
MYGCRPRTRRWTSWEEYMRKVTVLSIVAVIQLGIHSGAARADTAPIAGVYLASWNMVAGPANTDFSGASILWTWNGSAYLNPPTDRVAACQGYWAFFVDPTSIVLDSTATGPSQTCPLVAGWNILGNPFAGVAVLPAGVTGYWWNPDELTYDLVGAIPPGGAVWLLSAAQNSVVLQYQATSTRIPTVLTISNAAFTGPYTVHVGDSIKLLLPAALPRTAAADPAYLHIETAGLTGPLSCIPGPSCVLTLANQFWTWHAMNPGATNIIARSLCAQGTPCQLPVTFQIVILP